MKIAILENIDNSNSVLRIASRIAIYIVSQDERDEWQCVEDGRQIPISGLRRRTKIDNTNHADDANNCANDEGLVFFSEEQVKGILFKWNQRLEISLNEESLKIAC